MRLHRLGTAQVTLRRVAMMEERVQRALRRLATGSQAQRAADNPSNVAIAARMAARQRSAFAARRNIQDGVGLVQTADGGLQIVSDILLASRQLAVEARNPALSDADRQHLQAQLGQLLEAIDTITQGTQFNGIRLLAAAGDTSPQIQVGPDAGQALTVELVDATVAGLGLSGLELTTPGGSDATLSTVDSALQRVTGFRTRLGAIQRELESLFVASGDSIGQLASSISRIADADMALEAMEAIRSRLLIEAGSTLAPKTGLTPARVRQLLDVL